MIQERYESMAENEMFFEFEGKKIKVYPGPAGSPAVYVNSFEDEGDLLNQALRDRNCPPHSLIVISHLVWGSDLSPWNCPSLFKGDDSYDGGADAWISALEKEIIPHVEELLGRAPSFRLIAGYSLAGLFSVYALYKSSCFSMAASMSGSLWFPGFLEYTKTHAMVRRPDALYFSLGDKESRTRNAVMRTVGEKTEAIYEDCRKAGLNTIFEWNPGNHFQDPEGRQARGIVWALSQKKE